MFKYTSGNCLFTSEEGDKYILEMETPYVYETEKEAERDTTVYRFRKEDKKVKLIAYEKEWFITDKLADGRRTVRSIAVGDPISKYTYRQFIDLGGRMMKRAGREESPAEFIDAPGVSFDDLFPNLEAGQEVTILRGTCSGIREIEN